MANAWVLGAVMLATPMLVQGDAPKPVAGKPATGYRPVASAPSPSVAAKVSPALLARRAKLNADARKLLADATLVGRGAPDSPDVNDLKSVQADLKAKLDSMNEMGEMDSLRLQMAMDRLGKMMETLSNIMKKIDDTDSAIVNNMK